MQNNRCIPCPIGYTGSTCKGPCQYPKYGFMCQSKCDCNPQLCHHITGCPPPRLTCKAGRSGKYCEFPCRYPSYGQGCQEKCSCLQHLCNAETGCKYKVNV
ncbi:multiple epidermal growth factor-like domains protein 10 [Saccostrea cucullata]|uniref:multiple epidermal growth factor-like domains protein 10 n=1 Tax=Saccostrea cuccullata TaxID=36930 RepID=UPI002ED06238